ncbi:MAG: hypothetical protein RJA45_409 [Actinomycetota bacterium]
MTETTDYKIEVTDAAIEWISSTLEQAGGEEKLAIRLEAAPGGCQGLEYKPTYEDKFYEDDFRFPVGNYELVIDPMSIELVKGSTIDYKNSLTEQGLVIDNPNATSTCACGQSFC